MKLESIFMSVFTMMMVTLGGLCLLSCGDKEDDSLNGTNNGGGSIGAPQELLGAWQFYDEQRSSSQQIYVFNANGTGKIYRDWDYTNNTAREVQDFVYSYNRQNSIITMFETNYTLAFLGNSEIMTLSTDYYVTRFYRFLGELPTVGGSGYGGSNNGYNGGDNNNNNGGGNNGGGNNGGDVPSAPTGLTATQSGPKALPYVYLSWDYNSKADHYVIYRSTSRNGSYSKLGTNIASAYSDQNISNGKTYYYKVTAANSSNMESGYSNIASVTINTTIVETPGVATCSVTKGYNQITIKWTYASSSGYSAPDEVRLISNDPTYTGLTDVFSWTSASSKKSHTVRAADLSYGSSSQEEYTLWLQVKNSAGSGQGAKIVWNWMTNTGYVLGNLCGYTTF